MEPKELLAVPPVAGRRKCSTRHGWTSSGRRERVAEHGWRVWRMAMLLTPEVDSRTRRTMEEAEK